MNRYRVALVGAGILWSLGGLFIKAMGLNPSVKPSALAITCYRSLFAALCLALLLRGRTMPKAKDILCSIALYSALLVLYVSSVQGTTAANAILLQYTAPLYALVLGPLFFKEPFERADAGALSAAMIGIAILFWGNYVPGAEAPLIMGAASGALFGLFMLWLRRMREADPVAVTVLNNGGAALVCGAAMAWISPGELALIPRALGGEAAVWPIVGTLAVMGCIQIAAPYVLFSYGLQRVTAVEASLLALVEPLLSPLWVLLAIGERPTPYTIGGGALILAALTFRYLPRRAKAAP
ncbi:MAG: DMT family transporter [Armatimonadota bacterium]